MFFIFYFHVKAVVDINSGCVLAVKQLEWFLKIFFFLR